VSFPHDAWVESMATTSVAPGQQQPITAQQAPARLGMASSVASHRRAGGGRIACPSSRTPAKYAASRLGYFHPRPASTRLFPSTPRIQPSRPPWKAFVYGGGGRLSRERAAWANCFHADWEAAAADQKAYVRSLGIHHRTLNWSSSSSSSSSSSRHRRAGEHDFGRSNGGGRESAANGKARFDGPLADPIATEGEFGSGFCFAYNQVHLSWRPQHITAIFYVNDTLTPSLLTSEKAARRTKALADLTKLLPASLRGDLLMEVAGGDHAAAGQASVGRSHLNELADRLRAVSLERAAQAYERALLVQRWHRRSLHAGEPFHRRAQPLPIVQYRITRECFDMHAAALRTGVVEPTRKSCGWHCRTQEQAERRYFNEDKVTFRVPNEPPPEASCTSRFDACPDA